jgi:signal transduction histidine kinase
MKYAILTIEIRFEQDVVQARQRARQIAQLIGFDHHEQTRIATAVSEIARNAFQYAGGGKIEFSIRLDETILPKQAFVIRIEDRGSGIPNVQEILDGKYTSKTGMGLGIVGARRLTDYFQIESKLGEGTQIHLWKELPNKVSPIQPNQLGRIADALIQRMPENLLEEIQRQNRELIQMMEIIKSRELELARTNDTLKNINQELEETNRGVVALYTELDEKAKDLKKANEVKTRFLSYMSHEFRTPINSIIGLSRIVMDRLDGDLTPEQEKQIGFINRAAQDVLVMVNDLLDLSKAESGKEEIRLKQFILADVFSALKGLMRPLLANPSIELIFEGSENLPEL